MFINSSFKTKFCFSKNKRHQNYNNEMKITYAIDMDVLLSKFLQNILFAFEGINS